MPNFNGLWTSRQQMQARGGNTWPAVPGAPTSPVATAGNASASVAFTAPADTGYPVNAITGYRVTSSPGGFTGTGLTSPVTVTGLTNGTAYTFTVAAQNVNGYGPESVASNSVTPLIPNYIEEVFSTYLYTGTGSAQTITNNINLSGQGGLLWTKRRNAVSENGWFDSARGFNNELNSNNTSAQYVGGGITATSTGFTVTGGAGETNPAGGTLASWAFRKQPKFFDIVTYTGTGVNNRTIPHNLSSIPGCMIVKSSTNVDNWQAYHRSISPINQNNIALNRTDGTSDGGQDQWGNGITVIPPTSTNFTVGVNNNQSGYNYVAYLFAHDAGGFGLTGTDNVISCGTFTTNASKVATVNLGYEPQYLLVKTTSQADVWRQFDTMRGWAVSTSSQLFPNLSDAEASAGIGCNPTATGFVTGGDAFIGSATYIYIAIRRGPMKTPTSGTSVFSPVAYTGTGAARTIDTSQPYLDSYIVRRLPGSGDNTNWLGRLTGSNALQTNLTLAEGSIGSINWASQDLSFTGANYNTNNSAQNYVAWTFARAPGFFDEVCYTGTGLDRTLAHNLSAVPQIVIVKSRSVGGSATYNWAVWSDSLLSNEYLQLNTTDQKFSGGSVFNTASVPNTSTTFSVGTNAITNQNAATYVAYLFATVAGVSKVGSYTGTAALQTINCGFAAGARFVLIKRTDSTGDWYVWDSARGITSGNDPYLLLNSTAAEVTSTNYVDTVTTGFQVTAAAPAAINASGGTYIFLAIA